MNSILSLRSVKKEYQKDSYQSVAPNITVKSALEKIRAANINVFRDLKNISSLDSMGLPVYQVISDNDFNEWGKGATIEQCKASALMERVERFSSAVAFRKNVEAHTASFNQLKGYAVSRVAFGLTNFQRTVYGESFMDTMRMDWMVAHSLVTQKELLVPAQLVYLDYPRYFSDHNCSTGLAAGNSFEEAIVQAICEVVERHIVHVMHFNKLDARKINLESVSNPYLKTAIDTLREKGFKIVANDFSCGFGLSSVSAFVFHPNEKTIFPSYSRCGTSPDPEIALLRAITEIAQNRAVFRIREKTTECAEGFSHGASIEHQDELKWLSQQEETVPIQDLPSCARDDFREELNLIIKDFKDKKYDILVSNLAHPALKIPVVRILIPGLQPNFLMLGLHYLDKESIVTPHLSVYDEVIANCKRRAFRNQKIDERVEL